ncbi:MAG: low molecular weight protein-tyrosine-phosphatase [Verrucomicrobiota bacterium]
MKLLFVCMGNICRSPAAEGVMQTLIEKAELQDTIFCDSAGTIGYHEGNPADRRMSSAAKKRGYHLTSTARKIIPDDLEKFDLILTMDEENYDNVCALADSPEKEKKIKALCDYCTSHDDTEVPDPYYGGNQGFEHVLDLLEDGCSNLLASIKKQEG